MSDFMSYAQNREDVYINWLLRGKADGFYVDVGANDPVIDSVTRYFYLKGWRGINIEPIERLYKQLQDDRPRDITVQVGISQKQGRLLFTEYEGADGLSTLSEDYQKQNKQLDKQARKYEIEVVPLRQALATHLPEGTHIDFLKVDVEGYEYEVLASNDWKVYRPTLVVAEANHVNQDWRPLLHEAGYKQVFFDGVNEYYAQQDFDTERAMAEYPEYVIGPMVLDIKQREHVDWNREEARKAEAARAAEVRDALAASRAEAEDLRQEVGRLRNLGLLQHLRLWLPTVHVRIRRKLIWLQTPHPAVATREPSGGRHQTRTADTAVLTRLKQEDVQAFVPIIESAPAGAGWRVAVFGTLLRGYDFGVRVLKYLLRSVRKALA